MVKPSTPVEAGKARVTFKGRISVKESNYVAEVEIGIVEELNKGSVDTFVNAVVRTALDEIEEELKEVLVNGGG